MPGGLLDLLQCALGMRPSFSIAKPMQSPPESERSRRKRKEPSTSSQDEFVVQDSFEDEEELERGPDTDLENESPTQPPIDSQTLDEHVSMAKRQRLDTFARLQPLDQFVDVIDLFADLTTVGRYQTASVDSAFGRMQKPMPESHAMISKRHFTIERVDATCLLTDLSSYGTFINQESVGRGRTRELHHGDVISIAKPNFFTFMYDEDRVTEHPVSLTRKYLVTSHVLGKGGYGKVVLAKIRENTALRVAVKMIPKRHVSITTSQTSGDDVSHEVEVMQDIIHPNCLRFFDYFEADMMAYIVLEYINGGELFDRIVDPRRGGRGLGEDLTKHYACQLIDALDFLHSRGITHRDVKPENVLLVDRGDYTVCKLSDFGMSKRVASDSTMKSFCGTRCYMAPEMAEHSEYSHAVDMWSMGVMLFTCIVGYPPFSSDYGDLEMQEQIQTGRLVFNRLWKLVSREAQDFIENMLLVNVGRRLTAARALLHDWLNDARVDEARQMVSKHAEELKQKG